MKRGDDPTFKATARIRCFHSGCTVNVEEKAESYTSQDAAEQLAQARAQRAFNEAKHNHSGGEGAGTSPC